MCMTDLSFHLLWFHIGLQFLFISAQNATRKTVTGVHVDIAVYSGVLRILANENFKFLSWATLVSLDFSSKVLIFNISLFLK